MLYKNIYIHFSANKVVKTYVNGFLDCSGYFLNRVGNVMIGNTDYPNYNANQRSLLVNGRTQMNGNVLVNGNLSLNSTRIALGFQAGNTSQGINSVAIGTQAGGNTIQTQGAIAIGYQSGFTDQSNNTVAIGYQAGNWKQGQNSVAIGQNAGKINQSVRSVAIGYDAGLTNQGEDNIAIGYRAGLWHTGIQNTLIGKDAGYNSGLQRTGFNNTYIGVGTGANASNFDRSTAIGVDAQITASNQIVLGTATQTVILNTITPLYTSITFVAGQIGFVYNTTTAANFPTHVTGAGDILSIASVPIGTYLMSWQYGLNNGQATGGYSQTQGFANGGSISSLIFLSYSTSQYMSSSYSLSVKVTSAGKVAVQGSGSIAYVVQNGQLQLTRIA